MSRSAKAFEHLHQTRRHTHSRPGTAVFRCSNLPTKKCSKVESLCHRQDRTSSPGHTMRRGRSSHPRNCSNRPHDQPLAEPNVRSRLWQLRTSAHWCQETRHQLQLAWVISDSGRKGGHRKTALGPGHKRPCIGIRWNRKNSGFPYSRAISNIDSSWAPSRSASRFHPNRQWHRLRSETLPRAHPQQE